MEGTLVGGAVHLPNLYALPDHTIALSDPKKLSKYLDIYRVLAQGTFPAFQKKVAIGNPILDGNEAGVFEDWSLSSHYAKFTPKTISNLGGINRHGPVC